MAGIFHVKKKKIGTFFLHPINEGVKQLKNKQGEIFTVTRFIKVHIPELN